MYTESAGGEAPDRGGQPCEPIIHSGYQLSLSLGLTLAANTATAAVAQAQAEQPKAEITVLYDAFGKSSTMKKDWGFSALIEYGGKRILFDTGNNADIFAHNVQAKGVDLSKLDFAVISHRHGDHTSGLNHPRRSIPA